jgi:hypothetical protein
MNSPINIEHIIHTLIGCINALKRVEEPDEYSLFIIKNTQSLVDFLCENKREFSEKHESIHLYTNGTTDELWCRWEDVKNCWISGNVTQEHLLQELKNAQDAVKILWEMVSFKDNSKVHVNLLIELIKMIEITYKAVNGSLIVHPEKIREQSQDNYNTEEKQLKEILEVQQKYIELLSEELASISVMIDNHGWRSSRVAQGKYLRKQLFQLTGNNYYADKNNK